MAINIEIKARVAELEALRQDVQELADRPVELLQQEDVFFHIKKGRLKLRVEGGGTGQLIYYNRPDEDGPKVSNYQIYPTAAPLQLRALLAACLGERGVIKKTRWLYWVGHTRIHLDDVEGLGSFLELEVVLQDGQSLAEGQAVARDLCAVLGINASDLVGGAYIDLLEAERTADIGLDPAREP
jgi:predicted adenylyl cyclase CyaB